MNEIFEYLNKKKIPYAIDCINSQMMPVKITTQNNRVFANGRLISQYMATILISKGYATK